MRDFLVLEDVPLLLVASYLSLPVVVPFFSVLFAYASSVFPLFLAS